MNKTKLTPAVIELLKWIQKNPGKAGNEFPKKIRAQIRTAEQLQLIVYENTHGWYLTDKGEASL